MLTTALDTLNLCPDCGSPITPASPEGLCPHCLASSALGAVFSSGDTVEALSKRRFFGDYELLEELGRGGSGIIFKARQLGVNRAVALKLLSGGAAASRDFVHRFHTEASAAAQLEHPNIVPVYEFGEHEGAHFLAMRYLEGGTLQSRIAGQPLAPRQSAYLLTSIAAAIEYAHRRGILHRDLKPGNILLDSESIPHVSDFGLARLVEQDSSLTLSHSVLGTIAYLAPEVAIAGAASATTASDIYGLGAILYELLTGRPPLRTPTMATALDALKNTDPLRPTSLNPLVPRDLETICLKCLEKDPAKRYASAQALSDDLHHFLENEPISARPISRTGRLIRWSQRNPSLATAYSLLILILILILIASPLATYRINQARRDAERSLYAAHMRLASEALRNGAISQVRALLKAHEPSKGSRDLRGFEWRYLLQATDQSSLLSRELNGFPKPRRFPKLAISGDILYQFDSFTRQILAWNIYSWTPLPIPSQATNGRCWFYPRKNAALVENEDQRILSLYQLPSWREVSTLSLQEQPSRTAISSDARTIALSIDTTNLHRILIWDSLTKNSRVLLDNHDDRATWLDISPDNTVLLAAFDDGSIRLWSVPDGAALSAPPKNSSRQEEDGYFPPFFGPDSTQLFLNHGGDHNTLAVWNWRSNSLSTLYSAELRRLQAFAFSQNGAILATVWSGEVILLVDTKNHRLIGSLHGNTGGIIHSLAFSPSGKWLVSGGRDRTAKLWNVSEQRELQTLGGNDDPICEVAFTPDEKSIIALSGDGKIKLWDLASVLERGVLWNFAAQVGSFQISADERVFAACDSSGGIHVRELATRREIQNVQTANTKTPLAISLVFSPTDHLLGWAGWNSAGLLNYDSGQITTFPTPGRFGFNGPAFSPDGREYVFADATNILIVDVATRTVRPFAPIEETVFTFSFSPNGLFLASGHDGGIIRVWNRATAKIVAKISAHKPQTFSVEFSPDGKFLLSSGSDGSTKLWKVTDSGLEREPHYTLPGQSGWPSTVFSPDGTRFVSWSSETLKLWETATGLQVATLYGHCGEITGVAFSRDGNTLYSTASDGDLRIWQTAPPTETVAAKFKREAKP